jgi:hypothetical protein
MKSSSEIILEFILSKYYPSMFTILSSRVDCTPAFQLNDYRFDSHGEHKSFFPRKRYTMQFYIFICNNQELSKYSYFIIYQEKYRYFSWTNRM